VNRFWLFDARVPTAAPDGANSVITTLRLFGTVLNPPVLARAIETIWAGCAGKGEQIDPDGAAAGSE